MPVIHTLSFANYRNPTQTDLAKKKGVLDHRTGNSRECPGRRPSCLRPAFSGSPLASWLPASGCGLRLGVGSPLRKNSFPSSQQQSWLTGRFYTQVGSEEVSPAQIAATENEEGKVPAGGRSGRPGKPERKTVHHSGPGYFREETKHTRSGLRAYTCVTRAHVCTHIMYMHNVHIGIHRHMYTYI